MADPQQGRRSRSQDHGRRRRRTGGRDAKGSGRTVDRRRLDLPRIAAILGDAGRSYAISDESGDLIDDLRRRNTPKVECLGTGGTVREIIRQHQGRRRRADLVGIEGWSGVVEIQDLVGPGFTGSRGRRADEAEGAAREANAPRAGRSVIEEVDRPDAHHAIVEHGVAGERGEVSGSGGQRNHPAGGLREGVRSAGPGNDTCDRPVAAALQSRRTSGRVRRYVDVTRDSIQAAGAIGQRRAAVARRRPPSKGISVSVATVEHQGGTVRAGGA